MSFKQELANVIKDKNVAWVFCDEPFRTDILLNKTVTIGSKPANFISVSYAPKTENYCIQSFYWLPRFKHPICKKTVSLSKPDAESSLKNINSEATQAA